MTAKRSSSNAKVIELRFDDNHSARDLFGVQDQHLRSLEKVLGIDIHARGNDVKLSGHPASVELAEKILHQFYRLIKKGYPILGADIETAVKAIARDQHLNLEDVLSETIFLPAKRSAIVPRSPAQKRYIDLIRTHDVVFSIGPAGTGKTYLAVAVALAELLKKRYRRLVLARPAVEAGEKLGFLPGDIQAKVNPYLRPIYDALYDMLDIERVEQLLENDVIEIAPLAFMRGRTLHSSFVILDEAQNTTTEQMKMCLTRLGVDSKMVVTGDITQIDLPNGQASGLVEARRVLAGQPGIAIHEFTDADVVRHPLVQQIVRSYQEDKERPR